MDLLIRDPNGFYFVPTAKDVASIVVFPFGFPWEQDYITAIYALLMAGF